MTNKELLPCPFCGGEGRLYETGDKHFFCECFKCKAQSSVFVHRREAAIAAWNQRVNNNWISCSERLPENNGIYLTYSDAYNCHDIGEFDSADKRSRWILSRENVITHWQPLPEPPEEDNND